MSSNPSINVKIFLFSNHTLLRTDNIFSLIVEILSKYEIGLRIYGHLTKDSSDALMNLFSESLNDSGAKSGANE